MTIFAAEDSTSLAEPLVHETPLQILILVDQKINNAAHSDSSLRQINFMNYELESCCRDLSALERFHNLNNYFFYIKNFKTNASTFFTQQMLSSRRGAPIVLSLLYYHFARSLNLQFHLVHSETGALLRWNLDGQTFFIDLNKNGSYLPEDEVLLLSSRNHHNLRPMSLNEAFFCYLQHMAHFYQETEEHDVYRKSLDLILLLDPRNARYLAERALFRKKIGLYKEALCDLKRYFSFVEPQNAPAALLTALADLSPKM